MAYTTHGFPYPTNTGLVKDGAQNFNDLANTVDTKMGLYLISSTSATSGTTLDLNNVFSATYRSYLIVVSDFRTPAGASITMQLMNSGSSPAASNYAWAFLRATYDPTTPAAGSGYPTYVSSWATQCTTGNPAGDASAFRMEVFNPYLAQKTFYSIQSFDSRGVSGYGAIVGGGTHIDETSYNSMRWTLTASSFTNINVSIYGYNY